MLCTNSPMHSYPVIICAVNVSGHAKVSNFHQKTIPHQAVPCCQITMYKVLRCQVDHSSCYLTSNVKHLGETQLTVSLKRLPIYQDHSVWPMRSEETVIDSVRNLKYIFDQSLSRSVLMFRADLNVTKF